jgi:tetratricopeptide (TPR) repeat protein
LVFATAAFDGCHVASDRVRISAELGDPVSGDSIWSERYDRTMDDVFEIQDEIVSKMANTLLSEIEVTSLKRAKRKPTNKMTSYEYLLQGKFHKRKLTKDDANIAVDMFTNAIESDPSNGRAYAERCCTWADGLDHSWFEESDDDLRKKIRTTLEDAYELTDHDWDCHRLLCNISLHLDLNYDKAEEHGKKAYELNPNNPTVLASYGKSLVHNGKCGKGVELLRKAQELDPLSQQLIDDFIWGSYNLGDYDACIEFSDKIRKIRPNTWLLKIASFGALNRQEERDQEIGQFIESHGKDELSVQLEKLNFNSQDIGESTRNFVLN